MAEIKEIASPEQAELDRWETETLAPVLRKSPEARKRFESVSLEEVKRLYTPADLTQNDIAAIAGGMNAAGVGELPRKRNVARNVVLS